MLKNGKGQKLRSNIQINRNLVNVYLRFSNDAKPIGNGPEPGNGPEDPLENPFPGKGFPEKGYRKRFPRKGFPEKGSQQVPRKGFPATGPPIGMQGWESD